MNHISELIWNLSNQIKEQHPFVHCITNAVTVNDCANVVLAAGASPAMAHHIEEVTEITSGAKALVCNLGATEEMAAMFLAGKCAHTLGIPIVLDPVGVSGSSFRRKWCLEFIEQVHPTVIRGNYSEIRALLENRTTIVGVDADRVDAEHQDLFVAMKQYAKTHNLVLVASGETDFITNGSVCYQVKNGHADMARITGSGCMSSALLGAFLSVQNDVLAAVATCVCMGVAGELAHERTLQKQGGTMTFHMELIDALSLMRSEDIAERIQVIGCDYHGNGSPE